MAVIALYAFLVMTSGKATGTPISEEGTPIGPPPLSEFNISEEGTPIGPPLISEFNISEEGTPIGPPPLSGFNISEEGTPIRRPLLSDEVARIESSGQLRVSLETDISKYVVGTPVKAILTVYNSTTGSPAISEVEVVMEPIASAYRFPFDYNLGREPEFLTYKLIQTVVEGTEVLNLGSPTSPGIYAITARIPQQFESGSIDITVQELLATGTVELLIIGWGIGFTGLAIVIIRAPKNESIITQTTSVHEESGQNQSDNRPRLHLRQQIQTQNPHMSDGMNVHLAIAHIRSFGLFF